jgi:non-heme chloroperoxidase
MRLKTAAGGCHRVFLGIVALCSSLMATGSLSAAEVKGGSFTTSDRVKIHYLEAGKGPAIVFVPGWSMPAWIWESQIKHFSESFHVVALDPRSQGESEKVANGNDMERRARDVKELVEQLHLAPAVLVGWSLAVPELLSYAEQFGGDSVRAYVLVDGLAWTKQDLQFVASMLGMYHQVETNRTAFTDRFVRNMYRKPQPEEYIERVKQASMQMPSDSAVAASVSSVSRADCRDSKNGQAGDGDLRDATKNHGC